MDEEEAERAAASDASAEASDAAVVSASGEEKTKEDAAETTEADVPVLQFSSQVETLEMLQAKAVITDNSVDMETTEITPGKRRLFEGDAASQQRASTEKEGQWRMAGPKKA
ncbi:hypothetical protein MTO96_040738 [Rhipicephalus appendiculatus]